MRTNRNVHVRHAMAVAVRCAVLAMAAVPAAYAADEAKAVDPAVAELTQPTSTFEAGPGWVSRDSYKFGEYNGLQRKGLFGIIDFDLRGGGKYDSTDTTRWRLNATDLGLDSRNIAVEVGQQGVYRLTFGFDELRRNRSDTYQTPYLNPGSNTLALPGSWIVPTVPALSATGVNARGLLPAVGQSPVLINGVLTAPTAGQLTTASNLVAADVPLFYKFDLHTQRERLDVGTNFLFGPQWEFVGNVRHEDRTGTKPMGSVTRQTGGDISTILPDVIDQSTDQINLGVNWRGEKAFVQAGYYGSVFSNHVSSMTWQNWALGAPAFNTMSSAPSNQFHQFNLTGGYDIAKAAKLVANASLGRGTQNDTYLTDSSTPYVPQQSLHGVVQTTAFNLKLSGRPAKDFNYSTGFKYENRDNKTKVNTYAYYDANQSPGATAENAAYLTALGLAPGALTAAANINASRPYSRKSDQFDAEGDYHLTKSQWVKAGYTYQQIERFCDGSWAECADARKSKENSLRAEWRSNPVASVSGRIGYTYSSRKVDYNEDAFLALVPMANVVPTGATLSPYQYMLLNGLTGYGPYAGLPTTPLTGNAALFFPNNNALANGFYANGNRISELIGMRRYNMADRERNRVRSSVEWQTSDVMTLHAGFDGTGDHYSKSVYGLQKSRSWAINLDAGFTPTETFSLNVFATHEDQHSRAAGNSYTANSTATAVNGFTAIAPPACYTTIASRNANNKTDPCEDWTSEMKDRVDTIGLAATQKEVAKTKLDLAGGLTYSRARTDNNVHGGTYVNNPLAVTGAAPGTIAAFYVPATALPTVKSNVIDVRLSGKYQVDKSTAVRVGYQFQHLKVTDYAYDGMQFGGLAGVLPTLEQAPSYNVHVIGVSYVYTFQ